MTNNEPEDTTENEYYHFTPRPMVKKPTRLWDRKPSTPVNARSKSHKIWKRHSLSTSNTCSKRNAKTGDDGVLFTLNEDVFVEEINPAKSSGQMRYVKKMSVRRGVKSSDIDWEISFVETRLDTEIFVGKHKTAIIREVDEDHEMYCVDTSEMSSAGAVTSEKQFQEEKDQISNIELTDTHQTTSSLLSKHAGSLETDTGKAIAEDEHEYVGDPHVGFNIMSQPDEPASSDSIDMPATPIKEFSTDIFLPGRQIIEGDDAELFSNFLLEAQAKREANHALAMKNASEKRAAVLIPRSTHDYKPRQALETLDKNSPSSAVCQRSTSKFLAPLASPIVDSGQENGLEIEPVEEGKKGEEQTPISSPRKHGRSLRRRLVPRVSSQTSLRRSNGTEFIFLQKTEAQQLALTTKTNTKRNKGASKLPHLMLETINAVLVEEATVESSESSQVSRKGAKSVRWNEQNLVSFAEEPATPVFDSPDVTPGRRSSRRLASIAPQPCTPLRSPVPRKMRKLGTVKAQLIDKVALERVQVMTPPTIGASSHSYPPQLPSTVTRSLVRGTPLLFEGPSGEKRKPRGPAGDGDGDDEKGKLESRGIRTTNLQRFMVKLR